MRESRRRALASDTSRRIATKGVPLMRLLTRRLAIGGISVSCRGVKAVDCPLYRVNSTRRRRGRIPPCGGACFRAQGRVWFSSTLEMIRTLLPKIAAFGPLPTGSTDGYDRWRGTVPGTGVKRSQPSAARPLPVTTGWRARPRESGPRTGEGAVRRLAWRDRAASHSRIDPRRRHGDGR